VKVKKRKIMDKPRTPVETLRRAREIGMEEGLSYGYEGNVPGEGGENTYCHACGAALIERHGVLLTRDNLLEGGTWVGGVLDVKVGSIRGRCRSESVICHPAPSERSLPRRVSG